MSCKDLYCPHASGECPDKPEDCIIRKIYEEVVEKPKYSVLTLQELESYLRDMQWRESIRVTARPMLGVGPGTEFRLFVPGLPFKPPWPQY